MSKKVKTRKERIQYVVHCNLLGKLVEDGDIGIEQTINIAAECEVPQNEKIDISVMIMHGMSFCHETLVDAGNIPTSISIIGIFNIKKELIYKCIPPFMDEDLESEIRYDNLIANG